MLEPRASAENDCSKLGGFRFDVRDHESHQDRSSVEIFLIVKFAPAVFEFANRRRGACPLCCSRNSNSTCASLRSLQRWLDRRSRLTAAHEPRNLPYGPRECIVPAWWRW